MDEKELSKSGQEELLRWEQGLLDESNLSDEVKNLLNPPEGDESDHEEDTEAVVEGDSNLDQKSNEEKSEAKEQPQSKQKKSKKFYADKANKFEQSFNTLKRKLEGASKDPSALKALLAEYGEDVSDLDENADPLSDEAIINQHKSVSKMLAELKAEKLLRTERDKMETAQRNERDLFGQIEELQDKYPELQTEMSVEEINAVAVSLGGSNVSKEKFIQNGVSESDFENYNKIFKLNQLKNQQNLPDLDTAMFKSGQLEEIFSARYQNKNKVSVDDLNRDSRNKRANELRNVPREGARSSASSTHEEDGTMSEAYLAKIIEKSEIKGPDSLTAKELEALNTFLVNNKE